MLRSVKLAVVLATSLAAGLGFVPTAHSGINWPWWPLLRPDLRLASVGPSSIGPKHARVVITNEGLAAAGACYVRVALNLPNPIVKYVPISSMSADSALGIDVFLGVSLQAGPGLETEAKVDVFNQVSELNESNNWNSYLAPVW